MKIITMCAAIVLLMFSATATATPLNPDDPSFPSLGTVVIGPGTYDINTSGTPTLSLTSGTVLYTGTVSNGIAVFDFDNLTISAGASIRGFGTLPVALLSKGNLLDSGGFIDVSAPLSISSPGGPGASNLGVGNPGQVVITDYAPNGPPNYYTIRGGGGGGSFGGLGGSGSSASFFNPLSGNSFFAYGGAPGSPYGDLSAMLQGGSAGGRTGGGAGLGGGGALELGAVGAVSIIGGISANGGFAIDQSPVNNSQGGRGGGSGGGILIHGATVTIGGLLSATGGNGAPSSAYTGASGALDAASGGGGGGEIVIQTSDPNGFSGSLSFFNLAGGNGAQQGEAFINGVQVIASVPEPASFVMMGTAMMGVLVFTLRSRRAATLRD